MDVVALTPEAKAYLDRYTVKCAECGIYDHVDFGHKVEGVWCCDRCAGPREDDAVERACARDLFLLEG